MSIVIRTNNEVIELTSPYADIWIATDNDASVDYSYGGTRMVDYRAEDIAIHNLLIRLMKYESALKNRLINRAIKRNIRATYSASAPEGFMKSTVGGARCLIRPKNGEIASILHDPTHPSFQDTIGSILKVVGQELNERNGHIKLTPDFGHFADLSNILYEFTPHVLGINRQNGGCGGKTSYSSTGVIAALEALGVNDNKTLPITLIGAAGAMGSDILQYLCNHGFTDIAVCDLAYESGHAQVPSHLLHLPSQFGMFTDACLERGGVTIATTVGQELEHSGWQHIPEGTKLFLAHNLAIPTGQSGITLANHIAEHNILVLPGQLLTLGGALTSRLEWFWRASKHDARFPKAVAHETVKEIVTFLLTEILALAEDRHITPYKAMLDYADIEH